MSITRSAEHRAEKKRRVEAAYERFLADAEAEDNRAYIRGYKAGKQMRRDRMSCPPAPRTRIMLTGNTQKAYQWGVHDGWWAA